MIIIKNTFPQTKCKMHLCNTIHWVVSPQTLSGLIGPSAGLSTLPSIKSLYSSLSINVDSMQFRCRQHWCQDGWLKPAERIWQVSHANKHMWVPQHHYGFKKPVTSSPCSTRTWSCPQSLPWRRHQSCLCHHCCHPCWCFCRSWHCCLSADWLLLVWLQVTL